MTARFVPPPLVCKVGDHVRWISTSRGVPHHHTGVVVGVVPGGARLTDLLELNPLFQGQFRWQFRSTAIRPGDSYLVAYGGNLYWPRVKHLRPY